MAATDKHAVLITGANRGLGLEFALQYAAAGWKVFGTARRPSEADSLRDISGVAVVQLDHTDQTSVDALADRMAGEPLDLLINNGGGESKKGRPENGIDVLDGNVMRDLFDTFTIGPMRMVRAMMPSLRAGRLKRIVNVSSGLGSVSTNTEPGYFYGYSEAKAALNMFTRSLAVELAQEGFTVIAITPGWVKTDMGGPGAELEPIESVTGMRKVIDNLTPEQTNRFYRWNGNAVPW